MWLAGWLAGGWLAGQLVTFFYIGWGCTLYSVKTPLNTLVQVFRACLARFKLVPVQEDGRRRKKMQIKREREKEKMQEEEKGGSRQ